MESVTLEKNYQRRQFSPKAAKIAIEHYGWSEITTPAKPSEVGTKTKPPIIDKPIKLKEIPIEKKIEVNDDLAVGEKKEIITDDSGVRLADENKNVPDEVKEVKVKKTRKSPVKSKSK
jgi:hypothetical protein